ncbi:Peptidase propeptide and YPEB domain-containing protein [Lactobacillus crispatus]|uniref:PepSY domain-containing protein n=1 Tax=Lactobacillus crispatus TaxID=47770 RepID=UPI0018E33735|nr:PepSY domain-containing protein [Lactobacillus crispatus]MBI1698229.1 Peptidase propeptide and YPEB domain-containing protein [Lactobacillus crispatus]MBI1700172.1 Peptidase propeptide and YPEB domain-containing protein [Lactobacillus crispatus]
MKFTKLTSIALLSAALLTGTVACSKQDNSTAKTTTQKSVTSSKVTHNSESAMSKQTQKDNIQIKLSQQEAIDKFHQQFSGKQLKSIELNREGKHYLYEIEGFDSNNEYSVNINAETGQIGHVHSEKLDHDDRNQKALDLKGTISRDDASRIAEEHVKGTSEEWKLEQDEDTGKTYWEVKVKNGHQETEVKINAHTKEVISTEHDD